MSKRLVGDRYPKDGFVDYDMNRWGMYNELHCEELEDNSSQVGKMNRIKSTGALVMFFTTGLPGKLAFGAPCNRYDDNWLTSYLCRRQPNFTVGQ